MRSYLRVANVYENRIDTGDVLRMNFTPSEAERYTLKYGDILLNEGQSRELVGRPAMFRDELPGACFQNTLVRFQANEAVLPRYALSVFRYYFRAGHFQAICKWTTNIAHLGAERFSTMPLPLAPVPEQRRIADKLDALLTRVDACRGRLDRVRGILKRFRQSVLAAATSGELTRAWREEQGVDNEWRVVDLESVVTDFSYGSAAKSSKAGKVPVLRMGNIQDGLLDWRDLVFTSDPAEIAKYRLSSGDVLFNRTNSPELVGKTAVFRGERDAIYAGYLIRVRCSEHLLPDYLNYCLGSPAGREYCSQVKSDAVSQSNINARKLAAFRFGLPSLQEQREIIRRVEELFALNGALGTKSKRALVLVEHLTPSVLAKAFRGELVPQDPHDEPASDVVAKLRVEQSNAVAEPPRRRPKTPGKRPTMSNTDKDAVKATILQLKADRFSFDELRAQASGDYESLRAALFELLEEPSPVVRQVFDKKAKAMQLVRVKP